MNIHQWLKRHHGKASRCENENCKKGKIKRFEWALLKGKDYKKDKNNFIQLCSSCHIHYDFTEEKRKKMSIAARKPRLHMRKKINQLDKDGNLIKSHDGIGVASKVTNTPRTAISNVLRGRAKTAGGYKWSL